MQKSELTSFVDILNGAGVTTFSIRYEDGSRVSTNDPEGSTLVRFGEDGAYVLETDENYKSTGPFNIRKIDYNDVASIQSRGLKVKETLDIAEALGISDDEIKALIAKRGARIANIPGRSGYGAVEDKEGNPVINTGLAGRVTTGVNK